jgi:hypothetical protein
MVMFLSVIVVVGVAAVWARRKVALFLGASTRLETLRLVRAVVDPGVTCRESGAAHLWWDLAAVEAGTRFEEVLKTHDDVVVSRFEVEAPESLKEVVGNRWKRLDRP